MSEAICTVCGRNCHLQEGQTGFCQGRGCRNGQVVCLNYGRLTSLAMDPIEKKPLAGFHPGSWILSVGSYGCSFACSFCQNYSISRADEHSVPWQQVSPAELVQTARQQEGNLGIAFTYNEPLISWEYVRDTAVLAHQAGLLTVMVSNGCAELPVIEQLAACIDAWNIDYKGDAAFYRELGGREDLVRQSIAYLIPRNHVEVTTLIIPGKNDSDAFIDQEAQWLASLDPETHLHLSRYFPRYHCTIPATPPATLYRLREVAGKYLKHVHLGNL